MKKLLLSVALLSVLISQAQEQNPMDSRQNEVYVNAFNLIAFKMFEVSYERVLNEESSMGLSTLIALSPMDVFDTYRIFSVTPHYRYYFGNHYAHGFFMEAFTMYNQGYSDYYEYLEDESYQNYEEAKYSDLAFGVGIGGKFISHKGFAGEIHIGIGRNLFTAEAPGIVSRGGLGLGYRF